MEIMCCRAGPLAFVLSASLARRTLEWLRQYKLLQERNTTLDPWPVFDEILKCLI